MEVTMGHHYAGDDLVVRKIRVGDMENNTYLLECPETHQALLIDGCFEADKILSGCGGADVVAIVQTHGHADHVQALPELRDKLGVPVLAHPGDAYPVALDDELKDGRELSFGNASATVLHTPGHTPGSICLLSGRHLVSGDTLFPGGPGNTQGDARLFAQIIDAIETKLFTLPEDTAVYPGHGDDTTIGAEKPRLQEWKDRGW
ncbi:MAG TPA: MBL fold metallo-hydrolase [Actinomycetota bacterium]|nr:MBL fold metallo-hydrolase [Actinomycetota bacterium]